MNFTKTFIVLIAVSSSIWVFGYSSTNKKSFHTEEEKKVFGNLSRGYSYESNTLFLAAGLCLQCHGKDDNQVASVDASGNDINVMDDWAATMMANSSKDPLWRAKVSHEILVNPGAQADLEAKCTQCHAPLGNFNAAHLNQTYSIAALTTDSLGLDGVSCNACHQLRDTLIGKSFSGNLYYDTNRRIYGPYTSPFIGPMFSNIGFTPVYSPHINAAGLCAGCHTLQTETIDLSGNPTGDIFTEQATYHEWLNSTFNTEVNPSGITCQGCHMPRTNDAVILSSNMPILAGRTPFGKHHLVGANSFMLKLLKANSVALGVYATGQQFDTTIARTERLLQEQTLEMTLTEDSRTLDTVFYSLELINKAGHKFPSGYPSRRAYIEFVVMDNLGDTIFKTGILDAQGELINQNSTYEPHYNLINSEQQVQIYEMVMGDVNNNVTTVLQRAKLPLKDNRLTPEGFTSTHFAYDTCLIAGDALFDADFNKYLSVEGTGGDIVHFHIPLAGYSGTLNVSARVYYQSVPRKWLDEMFSYSSTEIDLFENMFNAADQTPVLVEEILEGPIFQSINEFEDQFISIYPNPVSEPYFNFNSGHYFPVNRVEIYDLQGKLIYSQLVFDLNKQILTPSVNGTYLVKFISGNRSHTKKLIVNR